MTDRYHDLDAAREMLAAMARHIDNVRTALNDRDLDELVERYWNACLAIDGEDGARGDARLALCEALAAVQVAAARLAKTKEAMAEAVDMAQNAEDKMESGGLGRWESAPLARLRAAMDTALAGAAATDGAANALLLVAFGRHPDLAAAAVEAVRVAAGVGPLMYGLEVGAAGRDGAALAELSDRLKGLANAAETVATGLGWAARRGPAHLGAGGEQRLALDLAEAVAEFEGVLLDARTLLPAAADDGL